MKTGLITDQELNLLKRTCEEVYCIDNLASKRRKDPYVMARHTFHNILHREYNLKESDISSLAGTVDRTTIYHSVHTANCLIDVDAEFRNNYNAVLTKVFSYGTEQKCA